MMSSRNYIFRKANQTGKAITSIEVAKENGCGVVIAEHDTAITSPYLTPHPFYNLGMNPQNRKKIEVITNANIKRTRDRIMSRNL